MLKTFLEDKGYNFQWIPEHSYWKLIIGQLGREKPLSTQFYCHYLTLFIHFTSIGEKDQSFFEYPKPVVSQQILRVRSSSVASDTDPFLLFNLKQNRSS